MQIGSLAESARLTKSRVGKSVPLCELAESELMLEILLNLKLLDLARSQVDFKRLRVSAFYAPK